MLTKGNTWNESETHKDALTGRLVRRITTAGDVNQKAPYHTRTTFTEDGEFMIFSTFRDGLHTVCRAHVQTGDITSLVGPSELTLTAGTIAPISGWVVYWRGKSLQSVNVRTLEERTIIDDIGAEWGGGLISVDPAEEKVVVPSVTAHPDAVASLPPEQHRNYKEVFAGGKGRVARLLQIPLAGGAEPNVILWDEGIGITHIEHNPVDGDLLYIDRDRPPMWHAGGDYSKTSRCWTYRISTGELTALPPTAEAKFQIHAAWDWSGELLLYHGPAYLVWGPCPWYIGAVRPDGEIYREWTFEDGKHYGHVGAAGGDRPAIIIDGNLSPDKMQWLYYDSEQPRFEDICEHNTEWNSIASNQATHPHPSTDRAGKYIAFNVARDGRTDVCVVTI
ncbi:MAG: hypothetical protein ACYS8X_10555 [Planctomycetota bacterium]|jgi:hypothetical protein